MTLRRILLCAVLTTGFTGVAHAKDYSAERFDARVELLRGGALRVTERVLVRFESGTFTQFSREIPGRLTDGIEVVSASMDGAVLPAGEGPGQVQIRNSSRTRITWRFPKVSGSSHLFELTYVVRGAIRQTEDADVMAWPALPRQHAYRIASSTIDMALPGVPAEPPSLEVRRAGASSVAVEGTEVRIRARDIRANGWVEVSIRLPRGSLIDAPPQWQQRERAIGQSAPIWMIGATAILIAGLMVIFGVRQGYDAPPRDGTAATAGPVLPDTLPPALAGALVSNGSPRLEHAMAALFSLADRGEVTIEEQPRSLGQSNFVVTRTRARSALAVHEQHALDVVFAGKNGPERSVGLGKARSRLTRHFKKFSTAVVGEMAAAGLMDEDRKDVRKRFLGIGVIALIAACVTPLGAVFTFDDYGGWPLLVPVALAVVGVAALICYTAHTPLSNSAVRRAELWRGFRHYLREIARDRQTSPSDSTMRQWLPFAVATGLAPAWATYLKRHRGGAPRWFHALADGDSGRAFAAFVGVGGAGHSSGAHEDGGGRAAGGGSSGAC
jgi:predicted membrane protein DUF2207